MAQQADWLRAALDLAPETVLADELRGLDSASLATLPDDLRRAKRRAAAVITDGEAVDGDANLSGMLAAWIHGHHFTEATTDPLP